jgi:hypothetical protein
MGMERVKHTEILAYCQIHGFDDGESWHFYKVVIAMDDVLVDHHAEEKK